MAKSVNRVRRVSYDNKLAPYVGDLKLSGNYVIGRHNAGLFNIYILLNLGTRQCTHLAEPDVILGLKKGLKLHNAELKDGKLHGTQGDLERYDSKFNRPVILYSVKTGDLMEYVISDTHGDIFRCNTEELLYVYESTGLIANAKVRQINGKQIISAISGDMPTVEVRK